MADNFTQCLHVNYVYADNTDETTKQLLSERILLKSRMYRLFNAYVDLGIQDFRQEIALCFTGMFELAEKKSSTNNRLQNSSFEKSLSATTNFFRFYDDSYIKDVLSAIDWRKFCVNYNSTVSKSDDKSAPQTALEEMLLVLEGSCNQSDLYISFHSAVRAAAIPIVSILFRVATSTEVYKSASGLLLRETISAIISSSPATSFVDAIFEVLESRLKFLPLSTYEQESSPSWSRSIQKSLENFNCEEAQQTLDFSIWLCKEHVFNQGIGPPLASILAKTFSDFCSFDILSTRKTQTSVTNVPRQKSTNNGSIQRAAPMSIRCVPKLHEYAERASEKKSAVFVQHLKLNDGREIDSVKLRYDMERRNRLTLQSLGRIKTGIRPFLKRERFICFRESLLDSLVKLLHFMNLYCPNESQHALTFRSILSIARQRTKCPGASICALVSASMRTVDNGMLLLMQQLWGSFVYNVTNIDYLRRYSDFVVVCRHFDDPAQCWEAFDPLLSFTFRIGTRLQDGKCSQVLRRTLPVLGRAIFHILVHRKNILSDNTFESRFSCLLTKLSFHFGDSIELLTRQMTADEKERCMETLCATGIVSFVEVSALNEARVDGKCMDEIDRWPFPLKCCIRPPFVHLAHKLAYDLLSAKEGQSQRKQFFHTQNEEKISPTYVNSGGIYVMDMINEDIIIKVFSFLGYKRIAKLGEVCKEWRSIGHEEKIWQQLYSRRWPNAVNEPFAIISKASSKVQSWISMFIKKWQVERAVRSKFSSDGWKHRTCEYIGCTSILRSPQQLETHNHKHKKDAIKRKLVHTREGAAKVMKRLSKNPK